MAWQRVRHRDQWNTIGTQYQTHTKCPIDFFFYKGNKTMKWQQDYLLKNGVDVITYLQTKKKKLLIDILQATQKPSQNESSTWLEIKYHKTYFKRKKHTWRFGSSRADNRSLNFKPKVQAIKGSLWRVSVLKTDMVHSATESVSRFHLPANADPFQAAMISQNYWGPVIHRETWIEFPFPIFNPMGIWGVNHK